jgi:hypothetical protein
VEGLASTLKTLVLSCQKLEIYQQKIIKKASSKRPHAPNIILITFTGIAFGII